MGILAHEHLKEALEIGAIRLEEHGEIGAFSIDIGLGDELLKPATGEKIKIPIEGLVVRPNDFYLWEFPSKLFLDGNLFGEVRTRSSYARLGIYTSSAPCADEIGATLGDREFKPVCSLTTVGTKVRIRPGETFAQLFVKTISTPPAVYNLTKLIEDGELIVENEKGKITAEDAGFNGKLNLTIDDVIHVYDQRKILDPQEGVKDGDFTTIDLKDYPEGYFLNKGEFFISSSVEKIATSNRYVSFVTPYISSLPRRKGQLRPDLFFSSIPFTTHPNAPYHAFGFSALRQITFENQVTHPNGIYLKNGSNQAELVVIPLFGPSDYSKLSRYHGQEGATLMKKIRS